MIFAGYDFINSSVEVGFWVSDCSQEILMNQIELFFILRVGEYATMDFRMPSAG